MRKSGERGRKTLRKYTEGDNLISFSLGKADRRKKNTKKKGRVKEPERGR